MNRIYIYFTCVFFFLCCQPSGKKVTDNDGIPVSTLFSEIQIVPLGVVNKQTIGIIAKGIEDFYGVSPIIEKPLPLTKDLLAKSGTRYEANKILSKFNSNRYQLFITEKDIAIKYTRRKSDEWGIMGLSYCPGNIAVVSTFRIKKHSDLFRVRLQKIVNHELGHSLGLNHCNSSPTCLMHDANGTMKQIDMNEMKFCVECSEKM